MLLSLFPHITGENVAFSILQTDRKCSILLHSGRLTITSGQFCGTDGKLGCFDVTERQRVNIYHMPYQAV